MDERVRWAAGDHGHSRQTLGARMRSDVHRGYNGYLIETGRHRVVFGATRLDGFVQSGARAEAVDLAILPIARTSMDLCALHPEEACAWAPIAARSICCRCITRRSG